LTVFEIKKRSIVRYFDGFEVEKIDDFEQQFFDLEKLKEFSKNFLPPFKATFARTSYTQQALDCIKKRLNLQRNSTIVIYAPS
jgi:hypothetical protein